MTPRPWTGPTAAEPSEAACVADPVSLSGTARWVHAPVAQRIEHLTTDQKVVSSNLAGRTPVAASTPMASTCVGAIGMSGDNACSEAMPGHALPVPGGHDMTAAATTVSERRSAARDVAAPLDTPGQSPGAARPGTTPPAGPLRGAPRPAPVLAVPRLDAPTLTILTDSHDRLLVTPPSAALGGVTAAAVSRLGPCGRSPTPRLRVRGRYGPGRASGVRFGCRAGLRCRGGAGHPSGQAGQRRAYQHLAGVREIFTPDRL
jgi:hypothetical protein